MIELLLNLSTLVLIFHERRKHANLFLKPKQDIVENILTVHALLFLLVTWHALPT